MRADCAFPFGGIAFSGSARTDACRRDKGIEPIELSCESRDGVVHINTLRYVCQREWRGTVVGERNAINDRGQPAGGTNRIDDRGAETRRAAGDDDAANGI